MSYLDSHAADNMSPIQLNSMINELGETDFANHYCFILRVG